MPSFSRPIVCLAYFTRLASVCMSRNESGIAREIDGSIHPDECGDTIVKLQITVIFSDLSDLVSVPIKLN